MPKKIADKNWTSLTTGSNSNIKEDSSSSSCLPCKRQQPCNQCGGSGCKYCSKGSRSHQQQSYPQQQQQSYPQQQYMQGPHNQHGSYHGGCGKCGRSNCRGECWVEHRCSVGCPNPCPWFCRPNPCPPYPQPYYSPCIRGGSSFRALITPATNLNPQQVTFLMKKKDGVVTLQWNQFAGTVGANGTAYLTVAQTICDLPSEAVTFPIIISYNSTSIVSKLIIDPSQSIDNIRFYLNIAGSGTGVTTNDTFIITGSSVRWIVAEKCQ